MTTKAATLSENALRVLEARYLLRGAKREVVETPDQLFERVAEAVAQAERTFGDGRSVERWRRVFLRMMTSLDFLPNSPTLMNAGTTLGQLSACFVIPVEDSMEGIFEAIKQMALVQRTGGGTGFAFSRLRPEGAVVSSTGGEASGPVSFMRIFDAATENIRQGGKRRGANMGVLRVDHPDVMGFVGAKLDGTSLQNFNISVAVTDAFMRAVRDDREYDLVEPSTGQPVGRLGAKEVFEGIVQGAWRTGDPGLLFLDAINRANPTPLAGEIEATNPCGEVPLLPWEACNLGSINLSHMVINGGHGRIDRARLEEAAAAAVRFLDDVIEVNRYPGPEFERLAHANRKIGLGVMGFAEMLVELDVSYDSDRAVEVAEEVMGLISDAARNASAELAEERGVFAQWSGSVYEAQSLKLRNATQTAIAPTGTIGIIAGTTASIEPMFALAYKRHALDGQVLTEVNPLFRRDLEVLGLDAEGTIAKVIRTGGLTDAPDIPEEVKRRFTTALEVPWQRHLDVQAAFQRHVDNSVSKTINMPNESTPDDVRQAFWRAWELGLKGVTVFRYGSRDAQVLEIGLDEEPYFYEYSAKCDPMECRV